MCRHATRAAGVVIAMAVAIAAGGCHHSGGSGKDSSTADSTGAASGASAATPVTMGRITTRTLDITVSGPGVVDVGEDVRVRAPFNGVITGISVNLGDRVRAGQSVGTIIAENSDAALRGARAMALSARTPDERAAAARALQVAQASLVTAPLPVDRSGIVIARVASTGERVLQGDSIVSVAATNQMIFLADVAQSDLARVHAGERAQVVLASRLGAIPAVVHGIVPSDTGSLAAMRVRLDLDRASTPPTVGLFGSATIVVGQHVNATVVPAAALVRDDITGVTRIALVDAHDNAHWVNVTVGVTDSVWAEILQPALPLNERVITTGMAGLPDSTRVVAARDSTAGGTASVGAAGEGATPAATGAAAGAARATGGSPASPGANPAPGAGGGNTPAPSGGAPPPSAGASARGIGGAVWGGNASAPGAATASPSAPAPSPAAHGRPGAATPVGGGGRGRPI